MQALVDQIDQIQNTLFAIPLWSDAPIPVAFSHSRLFRKPQYAVFAEIRHSRKLGDYVLYSIVKLGEESIYDLSNPIYETASIEDIADVWQSFSGIRQ